MCAEIVVCDSILRMHTLADAIVKRGLKTIVVRAAGIGPLVYNEACEPLARRPPHDTGLAMLHEKTFLHGRRADVQLESMHDARKTLALRESQIVRIARVGSASGSSERRSNTAAKSMRGIVTWHAIEYLTIRKNALRQN